MKQSLDDVVIIDACRTPFLRSGTGYVDLMAWEIGRFAVRGLLDRTGLTGEELDHIVFGSVATDIATTNVAREIALSAGVPDRVPAHTCTVACISSNMAISTACDMIRSGSAAAVLAGGVETFSDPDIKISKPYRRLIMELGVFKSRKTLLSKLALLKNMRLKDFVKPEIPSIAEYFTGMSMGETAERLARRLAIPREDQDRYAVLSHQRAVAAQREGAFDHEIIPVDVPDLPGTITADNGPRADTTVEKIARLRSAFDPAGGTVTAANSSFLTDGASAVVLMSRRRARQLGLAPQARIRDYVFTAQDIWDELLLGPAFAIPRVLARNRLRLADIDVFEIHEAFAVQMLAVMGCLASKTFARESLGLNRAPGDIPLDRLNIHGGSLSIGHPFGATGCRLVSSCVNLLKQKGGRYGIVAGCAAGAIGSAILIENC